MPNKPTRPRVMRRRLGRADLRHDVQPADKTVTRICLDVQHGWRCNLHPASERAYENHQWISLADYLLEQSGLDDYAEQEE
jgi:hypothetical protein